MSAAGTTGAGAPDGGAFDPLALTVWAHTVAMIAEEMGAVLVRAAVSPNIRERRDASAALFDAGGRMVAQAAHIPVHLGAMPAAVAAVRARAAAAGDVFLLNDPAHGGSHLPDLTLVEVIADPDAPGVVAGFAAVRAHHADVGGMSPGSMPQGATELVQEGLVLPPVRLARVAADGTTAVADDVLTIVLANVRTPGERLGDLRAQLAACAAGRSAWQALWRREGGARVEAACAALLDYAERRTRARLSAFEGASGAAEDALEGDGVTDAPVRVCAAVSVAGGRLRVDLAGTAPLAAGNVNCPPAVARAAAVFALRTLLDHDVPTNDGVARALDLVIPDGCAADARGGAAVAAGNVEMSQRLADVMLAALADAGLDVPAQGQGTMNNVTFGAPGAGGGWTFYETVGGGQGASSRGPGPSGVHVGMSNTRVTPVESLELAYPLRVERYALRDGSGGAGRHGGGDGVVRSYRALAPCTVTLLTERRRIAPRGAAGGGDGACGRNLLGADPLPAKARVPLAAGDLLTLETPGGGGWGPPARAAAPVAAADVGPGAAAPPRAGADTADAAVTVRELLDYTAGETARWEAWFAANPDALELPYAAGQLATVRGVVHHVFLVERRHVQRLRGEPVSSYDEVPASPDRALFDAGREARALFEAYVAAATSAALARVLEFDTLTAGRQRATARKLAVHVLLHGVRHWAQLASHLRAAGRPTDWHHDVLMSPALD